MSYPALFNGVNNGVSESLLVMKEENKVVYNNSIYDIEKINIFEEANARFEFQNYQVKINGNLASLKNLQTNSTRTLQLQSRRQQFDNKKQSIEKYVVFKDTYVFLDKGNYIIMYNDEESPIISQTKLGSSIIYTCNLGTLEISNHFTRKSRWNGIVIEKINF